MLIRFTVENFLSFKERLDFSMIASPSEQKEHHVVQDQANKESIRVLRSSIIYGANAAGKSNIVKAMDFARTLIINGTGKHENIATQPFKLDEDCLNSPSRFEFEFRKNGRQYAYGFVLDQSKVYEEWLFEIGKTLEEVIFERTGKDIHFNFNHDLLHNISEHEKDRLYYESKSTRTNLLFLTNCEEREIPYFSLIYNWIEKLIIIAPSSKPIALPIILQSNIDLFSTILENFDLGIERIDLQEKNLDEADEIPDIIKQDIVKSFDYDDLDNQVFIPNFNCIITQSKNKSNTLKAKFINTVKNNSKGKETYFEIAEESDGTQRIIDLVPMLIKLSEGDAVFVIDEIERSLHSLLTKTILKFFLNEKIFQGNNSQLIVTSHDLYLLDIKNLFRKDEIWFVEKDKMGQSIAYSLANTDVDNLDIMNGYINGRFGAIPFINELSNLGWKETAS